MRVPILNDPLAERVEKFVVILIPVIEGVTLSNDRRQATVEIIDNDGERTSKYKVTFCTVCIAQDRHYTHQMQIMQALSQKTLYLYERDKLCTKSKNCNLQLYYGLLLLDLLNLHVHLHGYILCIMH